MKLETKNGELMLPEGFTFDIKVTNPIFSNEGAASIATTLPATNENCKLLGRPERLARSLKPVRKVSAMLKHGVFQKRCTMIIGGCSRTEGIETSLAFQESELYADFKGRNMQDIFEGKSATSSDFDMSSMAALMKDLHDNYLNSSAFHENFALFPVAVEKDDNGVKIINEVKDGGIIYKQRYISYGDDTVKVPEGYGVTPFLWLHRAVRLLFELCGYEVVRNDFEELPFSWIVLVNNCSDTFCKGPDITFRNLVPSVRAEEFILWLYDRFGAFIAVNGKSVRIILQQNAFAARPDEDLTSYLRDSPAISYPQTSRVVLSCDTSIESAEPPADSLPLFHAQHRVVRPKKMDEDPKVNGVVFYKPIGKYYMISYYSSSTRYQSTFLGSNCFPYDRDNSENSETYAAADRFLPVIVEGEWVMPYIGDRVHRNTRIAGVTDESSQSIQICYALFQAGKRYGTPLHYSPTGTVPQYSNPLKPIPDLTPEGLYPHCWSRYNEMLLNATPVITAQIDYPPSLLMSMDICTPKILNGVKVIIESLSYQVSSSGIKCGESVLRILPAYIDKVEDGEVEFLEELYGWKRMDSLADGIQDVFAQVGGLYLSYMLMEGDGKADYTEADAPKYDPTRTGIIEKRRDRWRNIGVYEDFSDGTEVDHGQFQVLYEEWFVSVVADTE